MGVVLVSTAEYLIICKIWVTQHYLYCHLQSLSCYFHTVSCVPKAKVNHVTPCLSIMWKSRGSFSIKHLILILSLSLIVTTLGKINFVIIKSHTDFFPIYF